MILRCTAFEDFACTPHKHINVYMATYIDDETAVRDCWAKECLVGVPFCLYLFYTFSCVAIRCHISASFMHSLRSFPFFTFFALLQFLYFRAISYTQYFPHLCNTSIRSLTQSSVRRGRSKKHKSNPCARILSAIGRPGRQGKW